MLLLLFYSLVMTSCQDSQPAKSSLPKSPVLLDESSMSSTFIKVPFYELNETSGEWTPPDYSTKSISTTDRLAKVSYTFYGTKCKIVAHKGPNQGVLNIKIDEPSETSTVDLRQENEESNVVIFESPKLIVGCHKIQISYNDNSGDKPINVAYIYYQPYIDDDLFRKSFCQESTSCTNEYFQTTQIYETTIAFYGTRFWITGIHGKQATGDMKITIDDKTTITLTNPEVHPLGENSELEVGVLIYSSGIFDQHEIDKHTVKIECLAANLGLVSFFFSPQPYNAVFVNLTDIEPQCPSGNSCYQQIGNFYLAKQKGAALRFKMYGTRFWALGEMYPPNEKFQLFYTNSTNNENFIKNVYVKGKDDSTSLGLVAFYSNNSVPLKEMKFNIKYEPDNFKDGDYLKLYHCFYLNEQNIQKNPAHSILFFDLTPPAGWNVFTDDDGIPKYLYSTSTNAQLDVKFFGSKFWLEGTVGPNLGRIRIKIDGTERYPGNEFRLYREKHEDGVVYYESEDLPLGEHTVSLIAVWDTPVTFTRLLYNYHQPSPAITQSGFIRIYEDEWKSYQTSSETIINCSFNGTKVYIWGHRKPSSSNMDVYVDGKYDCTVNLSYHLDWENYLLYESYDLPFGEHTIEVRSNKEISLQFFSYRAHLIYSNAYTQITRTDFNDFPGSRVDPPYKFTDQAKTLTYTFHCTRFWLTGVKGSHFDAFEISISKTDVQSHQISTKQNIQNSRCSVLLYQSPVLPLGDYTITIKTIATKYAGFCGIITSQQPQDSVVIYAKDMKMNGTSEYVSGRETYGVKSKGSSFQFDYYGGDFSLIGRRDTGTIGKFLVYDNEKPLGEPSINTEAKNEMALANLYNSANLAFENHSIILLDSYVRPNTDEKYFFIYFAFYSTYSDVPFDPYVEITPEEFYYKDENWIDKDGYIESTLIGSKVIIRYGGSNFKLEGYLGPCSGKAYIYINKELNANVPLYREKNGYSVFYVSPPLEDRISHEIAIVNSNGNPISISKFYYQPIPPTYSFSESTYFSNSEFFTTSHSFSNSEDFTNSEFFTTSISFSESFEFTESDNFTSFEFTLSDLFSKSDQFSHSFDFSSSTSFSHSANFTSSELFNVPPEQTTSKSSSLIYIIIAIVGVIVIALAIVLIIFIYLRKKRNKEDHDENSFEANAFNYSIQSVTHNDDEDDEPNSVASDIFKYQIHNYEEDRNDFGE